MENNHATNSRYPVWIFAPGPRCFTSCRIEDPD